jgi:hypothetical protein
MVRGAGAFTILANLFILVGFSPVFLSAQFIAFAPKVKPVLHLAFPACCGDGPGISFDLLEEIYFQC